MAKIGLRYPVAAPITTETYGKAPTYGEGFYIGKAISAEKSIESNKNSLYGDDAIAESDTSFASGTLTLGVTDFGMEKNSSLSIQGKLLGHQTVIDNGVEVLRKCVGDTPPFYGIGYAKTKIVNGEKYYEATWLYKVQFQEPSESANTKGQNIEWQTPTISGNIMMVEGMEEVWEDTAIFTTLSQARTWIEKRANIVSAVSKEVLSSAISTAEGKDSETYTSLSYAKLYAALQTAKSVNSNTYSGQTDINNAAAELNATIVALEERS